MGLFDNLFGKKAHQDTGANDGQVDAPQNPDTAAGTVAPVVNNNVTISEDGKFAPPPTVQPPAPSETTATSDAADPAPVTEPVPPAESPVPAGTTEEVVGPDSSNLESPAEPAESSEEKTV